MSYLWPPPPESNSRAVTAVNVNTARYKFTLFTLNTRVVITRCCGRTEHTSPFDIQSTRANTRRRCQWSHSYVFTPWSIDVSINDKPFCHIANRGSIDVSIVLFRVRIIVSFRFSVQTRSNDSCVMMQQPGTSSSRWHDFTETTTFRCNTQLHFNHHDSSTRTNQIWNTLLAMTEVSKLFTIL